MSRASAARAKRRAAKRVGAVLVDSVTIDAAALDAAEAKGADRVEFIAFHLVNALTRLDDAGADIESHTVVTIGEHPDHPGGLTIEAKVSKLKPLPAVSYAGCKEPGHAGCERVIEGKDVRIVHHPSEREDDNG